jgi:predicted O-methyltransferase YrrM
MAAFSFMTLQELKQLALLTDIPIMSDETLEAISKEITLHHCFSVLEIGTAIGYSSLSLAHKHPNIKITTLEKDEDRFEEAIRHKAVFDERNQINMICIDAFEFIPSQLYDCIIIDGAKASNKRFFQRYFPFLKQSGCMLVDNIDFHGAREEDIEHRSRQFKKMIHKLNAFESWITEHQNVDVVKMNVGDGLLKITHKPHDSSIYGKIIQ